MYSADASVERSTSELTHCDGVVARPADADWPTAGTDDCGNVRRTHAAVHQVLGSTVLEAPMNCDSELILNTLVVQTVTNC